MNRVPLIVGFGGYGPAGRSSFHHAYIRTVIETLSEEQSERTILGLATMMKLVKVVDNYFIDSSGNTLSKEQVVSRYKIKVIEGSLVRKLEDAELETSCRENADVSVAGQLPKGFKPGDYYSSRYHPKGLQMTILAASDAVKSIGIDWDEILSKIDPSQISVYAGSVMSQLDEHGFGNVMQARLKGKRVTAKGLPLGLSSMPADFINAYVLGTMGKTGSAVGACATFLYNLDKAASDIRNGTSELAIVGNSEAPITPEIVEGYSAMSALATNKKLAALDDKHSIDYQNASRPFGDNCGFILSESAQYVVLMSDELALKIGADIHGSVGDVFISADGFKKSISSPGPGNYITVSKAVISAQKKLGDDCVSNFSFVQAHGSSTPQNRVSESQILSKVAKSLGISSWPVTAIKSYVGHSLSPASADQVINSLGVFKYGVIPGIKTIKNIAFDVEQENLAILTKDLSQQFDVAFINAKGFGGNNATAYLVSPDKTIELLREKHKPDCLTAYFKKRDSVRKQAEEYDTKALNGALAATYKQLEQAVKNNEIFICKEYIDFGGALPRVLL